MTTIYILKLEHGCYYVGKTNNYWKPWGFRFIDAWTAVD